MSTLVTVHSLYRWVVLGALLLAATYGFIRFAQRRGWDAGSDRPFALTAVLFDLQLALGIVVWIGRRTWEGGVYFLAIHPGVMLAGLAVAHVAVARARRRGARASYLIAAVGLLVALALVVGGVPWNRL